MKLSKEVLHKVRQIEITTRRMLRGSMMGSHASSVKGAGLEFDQLRDYVLGDDVRFIDWKTSARMGSMAVKEYIEERNRTIILLIDKSASTLYGSQELLKSDIINQVAAVFTIVAEYSKDYCGALLFNDDVIRVIPPMQSQTHTHRLMEEIFSTVPSGSTDFGVVCKRLLALQKKDAIVFLISDLFNIQKYEKELKMVSMHHELIAIECLDPQEKDIHIPVELMLQDPETGDSFYMQGNSKEYKKICKKLQEDTITFLKKNNIELLSIHNEQNFIGDIIRFFRKKMRA